MHVCVCISVSAHMCVWGGGDQSNGPFGASIHIIAIVKSQSVLDKGDVVPTI